MKKWNEWTKKQKVALGTVVAICLVGGIVGKKVYADAQSKKELEAAQVEIKKDNKNMKELIFDLNAMRVEGNPSYVLNTTSEESIEKISKEVDKINDKKNKYQILDTKKEVDTFNTQYTVAIELINVTEYQLDIQEETSSLFNSSEDVKVIDGDKFNDSLPIIDDLTNEKIQLVESIFNDVSMQDSIPVLEEQSDKPTWQESIANLLDNAKAQVKGIEDATKTIDSFFKDKTPIATTDSKAIENAQKQVDAIKNEKAKKELNERLKQVKDAVADKKTKEEAEAKKQASANSNGSSDTGAVKNQTPTWTDNNANNNYNNNGGGTYTPPANNGGGNYTPPTNNGGGGYTPPATGNNNNNNGGDTGGGYASQDDLNQAEKDASNSDWSGFF